MRTGRDAGPPGLSRAQLELLDQLLVDHGLAPSPPHIPRRCGSAPPPLSFSQQRLWTIQRSDPDNPAYNNTVAYCLDGTLDLPALESSLTEIVRRHEAWRTAFALVGDQPVQRILPPMAVVLPTVDLSHLSPQDQRRDVQRLIADQTRRPFDLTQGPLVRATVLLLGQKRHALVLTAHHIICDGWSTGLFSRELSALYAAFSAGQPSPLSELPIQYADYAIWQRQQWVDGAKGGSLAYWVEHLAGSRPGPQLPAHPPDRRKAAHRAGAYRLTVSQRVSEGLRAFSARQGLSLFTTLLAAFGALLAQRAGQDDIVVASPVANRPAVELEALLGCFTNLLPLRLDLSGDPAFLELVAGVRDVCLNAYANQDVLFEQIAEAVWTGCPVLPVAFELLNIPTRSPFSLPGLVVTPIEFKPEAARSDLSLSLAEDRGRLAGGIVYKADLFLASEVERLASDFTALLEAVASHPDRRLSHLLYRPTEGRTVQETRRADGGR